MRYLYALLLGLAVWWPGFAYAEGAEGSYRGIPCLYHTLTWGILCYGLYDTFGKTALYVEAPILAVITYMMLPPE